MITKVLSSPSLRTDSVTKSDYVTILKDGSTLGEVPLIALVASLFVPGTGRVVVVNRGEAYTESKWMQYAATKEVSWTMNQGAVGDILVSRAVTSDTKKALMLFQTILGSEGSSVKACPFLLIKEGQSPMWVNVPSST